MTPLDILSGIAVISAIAAIVYLGVALIAPEKF